MPKSPLESFFDNLLDAVEEAAEDLIRDVSKQSRENIRRMSRQLDRATIPPGRETQSRPLPQAGKRATRGREPGARPTMTTLPSSTLYDVLEVSPRASQETVSAAFRSLSSRFHPDTGKVKNDSRYKDITAAWSVLKDPGKRKAYDRRIGLK
jgi:DnaJ-domain-containing protein 1